MRIFVAALALSVFYFWDTNYNNGNVTDGAPKVGRQIAHSLDINDCRRLVELGLKKKQK